MLRAIDQFLRRPWIHLHWGIGDYLFELELHVGLLVAIIVVTILYVFVF